MKKLLAILFALLLALPMAEAKKKLLPASMPRVVRRPMLAPC